MREGGSSPVQTEVGEVGVVCTSNAVQLFGGGSAETSVLEFRVV